MNQSLAFPAGLRLLSRWQQGDPSADDQLMALFNAAIAGGFDDNFAVPAPADAVHVGGSINLMTLTIMNDLYGLGSAEFYKADPQRYVRTTMLSRRLLGMNKLYVNWPVYAFTAEAIGQTTMYPDRFPPGSDPDQMLIDRDNWRDIAAPDFDGGIPKIIEENIACYVALTGLEPILHLSAPYSLAADTFGQEQLLAALVHDPGFANRLLDHLVDHVHRPWIEHYLARFPNGWIELSDASGSPFFIGPQNCKNVAIRAIRRLIDENPWGHRVYDANYRGDYVAQAQRKDRSGRRRAAGKTRNGESAAETIGLEELSDVKNGVCRDFVIRLDDDRVPVTFYEEQAIRRQVPLFAGVGAARLDRNSIEDMTLANRETKDFSLEYVDAIKKVARSISRCGYEERKPPWPGTVYFEDVSSESSFELMEVIVGTVLSEGSIGRETSEGVRALVGESMDL